MAAAPIPTEVFETYWRFAAERMAIYHRRLVDPIGPWTNDPILQTYRFTNVYRASDRVSQYLIRDVQYREDRSQVPAEIFFRTILFKIFNKIETWELIERTIGPVSWQSADLNEISRVLGEAMSRGVRIYNAAYIMPSPAFGFGRKHQNHLALIDQMMRENLAGRVGRSKSLEQAYSEILSYPGLGRFLAFQYAIDLNYSSLLNFEEADFVVAGPGALDGISKCFENVESSAAEHLIFWVVDQQEREFERLGLRFDGLFGRRLRPIDCQNLFCEISKYSRVAHPDVPGRSGRTRIKQQFKPHAKPDDLPFFPPKWGLTVGPRVKRQARQFAMF